MRAFRSYLTQAVVVWALSAPLSAQWLHYPTADVPRTPAGTPDLKARTPRTGGKPDLSGMWIQKYKPLPCAKIIRDDDGECLEKDILSALILIFAESLLGGLH